MPTDQELLSAELQVPTALIVGDDRLDSQWYNLGFSQHSSLVLDGLTSVSSSALRIIQKRDQDEVYYLRYGLLRRLKTIRAEFRNIFDLAPPEREVPLVSGEGNELDRSLNLIYLNLRGCIDNLAFALLDLVNHPDNPSPVEPRRVDLFRAPVLGRWLGQLEPILRELADWHTEIKSRRDPAAHRIPLSVPPAFLTEDEAGAYQGIWDEYFASSIEEYSGSAPEEPIRDPEVASQSLGRFSPVFYHDPRQSGFYIYPTVSEDIGRLVVLCRHVLRKIDGD